MSLPASQRRALNQIEITLADDHPSLGPLFASFTRLTDREAMPVTERVTAWRWRARPAVLTLAGLAMAIGTLFAISLTLPGPQVCAAATVTPVAVHRPAVPAGRQPACSLQQNKPSETSQSGLYAP